MGSGRKKRQRSFTKKKLLINERVELRSVEDGFLGSWHPGTVIHCGKLERHVRYENILDDDGINNFEDVVSVSDALDGKSCSSDCYKRGFIRPVPPLIELDKRNLKFGLCVDVNYQEAWWEGVIFDHNDDKEERSVFFPDLGDEMNIGINQLRITQDWDEVTEKWKQRGKWVFLELIEECERTSFVAVSAKQIWYDVRGKSDFDRIEEWTFNVKDLWRDMVMEVVNYYLAITVEVVFSVLNLPRSLLNETPEVEPVEPVANGDLNTTLPEKEILMQKDPLPPIEEVLSEFQTEISSDCAVEVVSGANCFKNNRENRSSTLLRSTCWEPLMLSEVEFCPDAVKQYALASPICRSMELWRKKLQKHIAYLGWKIEWNANSVGYKRYRYKSPDKQDQKIFPSLIEVCKVMQKDSNTISLLSQDDESIRHRTVDSVSNEENVDQVQSGDLLHRVSQLLPEKPSLHGIDRVAASRSTANRKRKRKRLRNSKASLPKRQRNRLPLRVLLRSSKRVQQVSAPCLSHHKLQNVLSWLIDSNVVLPRSKVYYQAKSRHHSMADGRITRDGIKCNCCQTVFSLVGFENHASGSSTRRPTSSIFLEDGRSLLDCQIQLMQDHRIRETMEKPCDGLSQGKNDYICSVCHYGGELILCDQCPSSFHKTCLGMEDIPDGDWFCPSCRCGICGRRKINGDEDGHFLTCIQCEHKYHFRCVKNKAVDKSRRYLKKNWFCGKNCEKIYAGLHKLLGVPASVGLDNLTWTLVKFINSESCDRGSTKSDLLVESYSKLNVALSVMHECFEPLKEPYSSRDLMEDVIFSRWSELNRLNFQGFYTVLLERNEELISVATVRVYGDKVAEIPLVGTRLQYRRHGMCRILMTELEKKLMQLGVERLVLPAVPSVLETWTSSFGFAKMTNLERSEFVDYTFLDFQGSIMCQKLLTKIPSPDSVSSIDAQQKQNDVFSGSCRVDFEKSSPDSEVYQAEEIDNRGLMDRQMGVTCAGNNDHLGSSVIDPVTMVKQLSPEDQQCHNGTNPQCSVVKGGGRYSGSYKYYSRRKVRKV